MDNENEKCIIITHLTEKGIIVENPGINVRVVCMSSKW